MRPSLTTHTAGPLAGLAVLVPVLVRTLLILAIAWPMPALAVELWGHEDEYGIVHLGDHQVTEQDVLIYSGEEEPHLGFEEIKRLIRKNGGQAKKQDKEWIKEATPEEKLKPFPKLRTSGPMVDLLKRNAKRHGVDYALLYAIVEQESGFDPGAVSPKGAMGLMQIMPEAQQVMGLSDPFDPATNVDAGTRYLKMMLNRFHQDIRLALAAYNAGPLAVEKYDGIPPYPETMEYVNRIMYRYSALK